MAPNEIVGVFVGSWAWGDDALYVQTVDNATDIVLGASQLGQVPVGNATVFMDRSTEVAASEATSEGGLVVGKYRAENRQVQIVN